MKILVIADEVSKLLYDHYKPGMLDDIDLIISCGDLRAKYLTFLVTMAKAPLLYVHGNHDCYQQEEMLGCINIEDDVYVYKGIRIMGLGGSMEYLPDAPNQYTERKMKARIKKMWCKLLRAKGVDILVTHAPAFELNDMEDLPHRGFKCFLELLDKYRPKYFIHGHIHANYGNGFKRVDRYKETTVVNAYEKHIIEYPDN